MADEETVEDPLENYTIHPQDEEPNIESTALGVFKLIYTDDCETEYATDEDGESVGPHVYQLASLSRRVALILNGYLRHVNDIYEGPVREFAIHLQYQKAPMKSATWNVMASNTEDAIAAAKVECKKKFKNFGHCISVNGEEYNDD